jgi:predicted AlkP superfamily phosphohydrolase/phosphomutase
MQKLREIKDRGSRRKIFLLALDSTPLEFLQDNISSFPNIRFLMESGKLLQTNSPANRFSASPWQTFAYGVLPGEHGHYFPMQWDPLEMRFIPIKDRTLALEPFWGDLARSGVETIVFDAMAITIPLTEDTPGIQIINWDTQCNFTANSNRPEILKYIKRHFGKKPIGDEIAVKKSRHTLEKLRDQLVRSAKLKTDAILWLMQEFEWRCFITAYFEGHRAGHNLWPIWDDFSSDPPEDAMLDVYRELDTQLGRLLGALNLSDTAFVLFSMHGMVPGYAQDHFLPTVVECINNIYLRERGHRVPLRRGTGLARILRQTVPPSIQQNVRELVGQTVQDWLVDREWRGGKNWTSTPAFPVPGGGDVGFVRLNIKGRERDGFLPASTEGRNDYVEFLCRALRGLRVKQTGEPLIKDIIMTEEEFQGPRSHLLPDILLLWKPDVPATEIYSDELGTIKATLKTGRGGNHTGDSFAILAGAIGDPNELPPLSHVRDYGQFLKHYLCQTQL